MGMNITAQVRRLPRVRDAGPFITITTAISVTIFVRGIVTTIVIVVLVMIVILLILVTITIKTKTNKNTN